MRALTEQLAHELRNAPGSRVSAHLLVPGSTFTGLTAAGAEKPAGAWTPEQVVERMIGGVEAGDFYIYCPDNAVSEALDALRLQWSVGDIIENRPALSRWHPEWKGKFDDYRGAGAAPEPRYVLIVPASARGRRGLLGGRAEAGGAAGRAGLDPATARTCGGASSGHDFEPDTPLNFTRRLARDHGWGWSRRAPPSTPIAASVSSPSSRRRR